MIAVMVVLVVVSGSAVVVVASDGDDVGGCVGTAVGGAHDAHPRSMASAQQRAARLLPSFDSHFSKGFEAVAVVASPKTVEYLEQ